MHQSGILIVNAFSDHPLALYVFSQDAKYKAKGTLCHSLFVRLILIGYVVFDNTQSGACLANELLVHIGST